MSVHNWFAFGPRWPNVGHLVAKKMNEIEWKLWFPTIFWKSIHAIQFKLGVHTCLVSLEKLFHFLLHMPNLAPLVAINVFPFCLIRPEAGMCILWCLVNFKTYFSTKLSFYYLFALVLYIFRAWPVRQTITIFQVTPPYWVLCGVSWNHRWLCTHTGHAIEEHHEHCCRDMWNRAANVIEN